MDSKKFKQLQDKWYAKLEESGFVDIEERDVDYLKDYHSQHFAKHDKTTFETTKAYYESCQEYLNLNELAGVELEIWTMHTEGMTIRAITRKTNKTLHKVFTVVTKARARMKELKLL